MKAKVMDTGSSFEGLLRYMVEGKAHEHVVKNAQTVSTNMAGVTLPQLTNEFWNVAGQRRDIHKPVLHMALSLPPGETATAEKWDELVRYYLDGLGIDIRNHQYVAMMHSDTPNQHVHIAVNRVGLNAKIYLNQRSQLKAIDVSQAMEQKFGLKLTPGLDKLNLDKPLSEGESRSRNRTGEEPKRFQLAALIRQARGASHSFPKLIEELASKGIRMSSNGLAGTVSGASFEYQGVFFAGSSIAKECAWQRISEAVHYDPVADAPLIAKLRAERVASEEAAIKVAVATAIKRGYEETIDSAMADLFGQHSIATKSQVTETIRAISALLPQYTEAAGAELRGQLVGLGMHPKTGQITYTSKAILERETRMVRGARLLAGDKHHDLTVTEIYHAIAAKESEASAKAGRVVTMTEEQRAAVRHGFRGGFCSIQGSAGAGKSFSMEVLRLGYEERGYQVLGCAIAKRAAQNLEEEAGIRSFTIAKLLSDINAKRVTLDRQTLLVVDEAGQVGSGYMSKLIEHCRKAGSKLVLTGEDRQLDAIQHGGSLRFLSRPDVVGTSRVQTILRQSEAWVREAVAHYRDGEMDAGLQAFETHDQVRWIRGGADAARAALVADWRKFELGNPGKSALILAHSNADARALGAQVRAIRKREGRVTGPDYVMQGTHSGKSYSLMLAQGDRIRFGHNDEAGIGAINGTLGTITSICQLKGPDGKCDYQLAVHTDDRGDIEFRASEYCDESGHVHLAQAYAMTTYSSQGLTVKGDVFILQTRGMDRPLTYVANSRAKDLTHTYIDRDGMATATGSDSPELLRGRLLEQMGRDDAALLSLEVLEANRPGYLAKTFGTGPTAQERVERDAAMAAHAEADEDELEPITTYEDAMAHAQTDLFGRDSAITVDRFNEAMAELEELAPAFAEKVGRELREQLIHCGSDEGGRLVFTTDVILQREIAMVHHARTLAADAHHTLSPVAIAAAIEAKERQATLRSGRPVSMTDEQRAAVAHALRGGYASLQGSAGAGKSFAMEAVKLAYEQEGYKVYGAAISKKAAQNLQADAGIESYTVAKLLKNIEHGGSTLNHRTCLVIDEAGQVGTGHLSALLCKCEAAGAKLVFAGEDKQLDAIQHGGALRFLSRADIVGTSRIQAIQRQDEAWARKAVEDYRDGRMAKGLKAFEDRGLVHYKRGGAEATQEMLIREWRAFELGAKAAHKADPTKPQKQTLILAHSNANARSLGERVREIRREEGLVTGPDFEVKAVHGDNAYKLKLAVGDRVRFTKNDEAGTGVINGTLGTVLSIEPTRSNSGEPDYRLRVMTDDRGEVAFRVSDYSDEKGRLYAAQAYSSTIYSAQGLTIAGDVFVYQTPGMDRANTYVANSRARGDTHTYIDRDAASAMARSDDDSVIRQHVLRAMERECSKRLATEYLAMSDPDYIRRTFGDFAEDRDRIDRYTHILAVEAADAEIRATCPAEAEAEKLSPQAQRDAAIRARFAAEALAERNRTVLVEAPVFEGAGPRGKPLEAEAEARAAAPFLPRDIGSIPLQRPGRTEPVSAKSMYRTNHR